MNLPASSATTAGSGRHIRSIWHTSGMILCMLFTHTDKGFFYMMGQLFVRPGKVAYEYIVEAKRKRYFPPFQYLIIISAIATIIVVNSNFVENTLKTMDEFTGSASTRYSPRQAAFMHNLTMMQTKYYNIMIATQIPFFALAALIIYRRKFKYNYAEFLTLQTLVTAQYTIVAMVLMLTVFITRSWMSSVTVIMFIFSIAFHCWTYMHFFKEQNFIGFLKAFGSHLLGLVIYFLCAVLIGFLVGMYIAVST